MRPPCVLLCALLFAACNQSDFDNGPSGPINPEGPGTPAWGEEDVACSDDGDCHTGEVCKDSVCQMQRCADQESYHSVAPIGERRYFFRDRELVVVDSDSYMGDYWVDGYAPGASSITYPSGGGSWDVSGSPLSDVTGGNLLGTRPEVAAASIQGTNQIIVPAAGVTMITDYPAVAIAAGDVDHDGTEEVVAIGEWGNVSVCHATTESCDEYYIGAVTGVDVAVADIDGDHFDEPVFLIDNNGTYQIVAWNVDHETTGQPEMIETTPGRELFALTAGDVDGDGRAEIYALEDGGWLGYGSDTIVAYTMATGSLGELGTTTVDNGALDLTTTDINQDRKEEIVLLRDDPLVEVFKANTPGSLASMYTSAPSVSGSPVRIGAVDFDGDSPAGRLVDGPILIPGAVVPTVVLYMPPYYKSLSEGVPWVWLGDAMNTGQSLTDTVALNVGVTVGVDAEFPAIAEAELETTLSHEITASTTYEVERLVGDQFYLEVNPELYGTDYAAVVLSCGCFHQYTYEMEDPSGQMGGNGDRFVILSPVGGQTTMWSTKRYNAMAEALGGLPIITVPHEVGNPHSYPDTPQHADGAAISADDNVFPVTPNVRVSDVGDIGWALTVTENEINEIATNTQLDVEGAVTVAGFKLGGQVGVGWGQGYSVTVGTQAEFIGGIPPLPDDPATPEDEYATYAYSLKPVVYREHYLDKNGHDAGYYVLNYSVGF